MLAADVVTAGSEKKQEGEQGKSFHEEHRNGFTTLRA
jgi:hypothetical protein